MGEAAKQRLRVKEESYKAYIEEELSLRNVAKRFIKPELRGIGQLVHGAGIGDGKHRGSRMKGGVFS